VTPTKNSTTLMSANAVSSAAAMPGGGGLLVSLFNRGPGDAFVEFSSGNSPVAVVPTSTVAGGYPIMANAPAVVLQVPADVAYFAAVSTSNSTVYVSRCHS
jgi:hypothetical protein